MTADVAWYVVAKEPPECNRTDVFGPFLSHTDAAAYAMDLHDDNGWASCDPTLMTHEQATELATDTVTWPYQQSPDEIDEWKKEE